MSFIWTEMLWALLLLPVLIVFYILMQRRRQKYALRYSSLSIVKEALGRGPGFRRHIPAILFLLGVAALIFALARPAATVTLPSLQATVILTIDVSGSMRAQDMEPSRMEAAKKAARAFVEKQPEKVRIGVVSFSAHAALVQEPTADREAVLAAINRLRTQRGTAVGSAIITSLNALFDDVDSEAPAVQLDSLTFPQVESDPIPPGSFAQAAIVLLSDGQSNQGPPPLEVVGQTANLGVRIFTVGVGSAGGSVISAMGRSIRVFLDEDNLKAIAERTGASYFKADTETDLQQIYENLSTNLVLEIEKTEITVFFTAAAALVLLVAGILSLVWFGRLP